MHFCDGNGRRARTVNSTTGTIEYFGYGQDGRLLQDWSNRRNVRNGYIYPGNTLVGLYEVTLSTGAVVAKYKHTDALGSPVVTTKAGTLPTDPPVVLSRTSYTPYGAPTLPVDGVGYTGHFIDVNTSLTYMQQRYYDPQIGRFLSNDPMTVDTKSGWNFNRYNYGADNPFRFKDPDGRKCTSVDGKDSCTFDSFQNKDGDSVSRDDALASSRGPNILRAEAQMTAKYTAAKALAARNGTVRISGNEKLRIPAQTISGAAIVGKMQSAITIAAEGPSPGDTVTRKSPASTATAGDGNPAAGPITFWSDGAGSDVARNFGHEILHELYSERRARNMGWANPSPAANNAHQTPFDEASDDMQ